MNTAADYLSDWDLKPVADITEPLFPFQRRAAILRRLLPATRAEIIRAVEDGWPSMVEGRSRGALEQQLLRDLLHLGAVKVGDEWTLPPMPRRARARGEA